MTSHLKNSFLLHFLHTIMTFRRTISGKFPDFSTLVPESWCARSAINVRVYQQVPAGIIRRYLMQYVQVEMGLIREKNTRTIRIRNWTGNVNDNWAVRSCILILCDRSLRDGAALWWSLPCGEVLEHKSAIKIFCPSAVRRTLSGDVLMFFKENEDFETKNAQIGSFLWPEKNKLENTKNANISELPSCVFSPGQYVFVRLFELRFAPSSTLFAFRCYITISARRGQSARARKREKRRREEVVYISPRHFAICIQPFLTKATVVCDCNGRIIGLNPKYPGRTHDAFIWSNSLVREHMEKNYAEGDKRSFLLGDSGYPLQPWLLTPYRATEPGSAEERYQDSFVKVRCGVEQCIGRLKGAYR
ncbi:unnamed protein product [Nesidiocoris tenuis]|uniref:DDE Tnp4 domain-containing protein n=1 Tax=Nesidiocoris tenuis TaxID=355587 RepID=A0A6H5GRQ8_9HEMI|nr:unnamed protein product [Nesidiocoris tenuis]